MNFQKDTNGIAITKLLTSLTDWIPHSYLLLVIFKEIVFYNQLVAPTNNLNGMKNTFSSDDGI